MNISETVRKHNFRFSKKFGQNFIGDENLLNAIVGDAGIEPADTVLEIGTGAGTLTKAVSQRAKKVITFEIDPRLQPLISDTLSECNNCQVILDDIMKWSAEKIDAELGDKFKVVANLPYYITTDVLFRLLDCKNIVSLTVMVQKEVAERICADADTADYGALSVAVQLASSPVIKRIVPRTCFTPQPNVDSAIVRMDIIKRSDISDGITLKKLVRAAFAMRRKTLVNNLIAYMQMTRHDAENLLRKAGFPAMIRGEALSVEDFIKLSDIISKKLYL